VLVKRNEYQEVEKRGLDYLACGYLDYGGTNQGVSLVLELE